MLEPVLRSGKQRRTLGASRSSLPVGMAVVHGPVAVQDQVAPAPAFLPSIVEYAGFRCMTCGQLVSETRYWERHCATVGHRLHQERFDELPIVRSNADGLVPQPVPGAVFSRSLPAVCRALTQEDCQCTLRPDLKTIYTASEHRPSQQLSAMPFQFAASRSNELDGMGSIKLGRSTVASKMEGTHQRWALLLFQANVCWQLLCSSTFTSKWNGSV